MAYFYRESYQEDLSEKGEVMKSRILAGLKNSWPLWVTGAIIIAVIVLIYTQAIASTGKTPGEVLNFFARGEYVLAAYGACYLLSEAFKWMLKAGGAKLKGKVWSLLIAALLATGTAVCQALMADPHPSILQVVLTGFGAFGGSFGTHEIGGIVLAKVRAKK